MSVESVMSRIAEIQAAFAPPIAQPVRATGAPTASAASAGAPPAAATGPTFSSVFGTAGVAPVRGPVAGDAGERILAAVRPEVGVAEQPPGSNDSPRIAEYRRATEGAPGPGPWCAYFTSWAARQAGVPVGDHGQGFGSVDALYAWAQSAGKVIPAGSGRRPQPGDLIVWDEHIGVVDRVDPDGRIHTIEGNSSDKVSQRTYGPDGGGAIGYVRLG